MMSEQSNYINENRILEEFQRLVGFDSESFCEADIAAYLKKRLLDLGLSVFEDSAREQMLSKNPQLTKAASNIYGFLKGNVAGETILFSSHMDTVSPGNGKKAILHEDGKITSDGSTVLGADDISGIVSILEALTVIRENQLEHPDIEVLFTMAEEPYCEGSRYVEYDRIKANYGYVLDLVGPVGRAANAAPSILSLKVEIKGRAAHAGFAPEEGVNALNIAVDALSGIPTGHIGEDTTVNFGLIRGGSGKNIVPENVVVEGEIRSLVHEKALREVEKIQNSFREAAGKYGGTVEINVIEHIHAYHIDSEENVIKRFLKAVPQVGQCIRPECITTFGGSDANRLNEHGISTIVLACAMENCHSRSEYTHIDEIKKSAELTLKLMTIKD